MAENNQQFKCSGNCLQCQPAQRQYCAAQHSYSNMKVLDKMMELLQGMVAKIEAIQSSEATVFNPKETAQEEDGAENRSSHK